MKLRDLSFISIVVVVVGGIELLSFVNKPPATPDDRPHTTVSRDSRAQCLQCHQPETMWASEQAGRHPIKWRDARFACLLCHVPSGGVKDLRVRVKPDSVADRFDLQVSGGNGAPCK